MIKGVPPKHPTTAISFAVLGVVAFFLSALLTYVFFVSWIMGLVLLVIYIVLGVFGYRLAHVHTKLQSQDDYETE